MNQETNNENEMPVNPNTGVADEVSVNIEAIINECLQTQDINRLTKLFNENLISEEQYKDSKRTIEISQGNAYAVASADVNTNQQNYYSANAYGASCNPSEYEMQYKKTMKMYNKVLIGTVGYLIPIVNILVLPLNIYLLIKLPFGTFYFPNEIYREQFKSVRLWTLLGFIPIIGWPLLIVAIFKTIGAKSRLSENIMQYTQMYNMRNFSR